MRACTTWCARCGGGKAFFLELEVTDQEQWDAAVAHIRDQSGALHILMNIVGSNALVMLPEADVDEWNKMFEINVTAPLIGMQTCAPLINESGGGVDTLDFSATTSRAVAVNLSNPAAQVVNAGLTLTLSAGNTIENVTGGALGDTLTGNALNNSLSGGAGNDTLDGGAGTDALDGGAGTDVAINGEVLINIP